MTRYLFGGDAASFLTDEFNRPLPGGSLTVYTDAALTVPCTDLLDRHAIAVATVTADPGGYFAFYGPDGVTTLYAAGDTAKDSVVTLSAAGQYLTLAAGNAAFVPLPSGATPGYVLTVMGDGSVTPQPATGSGSAVAAVDF